jgi:hypothetical protein
MTLDTRISRPNPETGELEPISLKWHMWHVQCMVVAKCKDDEVPEALMIDQLDEMHKALDLIRQVLKNTSPAFEENEYLKNQFDLLGTQIAQLDGQCQGAMWAHIANVGMTMGHRLKKDYTFSLDLSDTNDEELERLRRSGMAPQESTFELKENDVLSMNIPPRGPIKVVGSDPLSPDWGEDEHELGGEG